MRLRQPSVLPGFGLTLGVTLTWLSLIVLLPLAALALKTATLTWGEFWAAVTDDTGLAAALRRLPDELEHTIGHARAWVDDIGPIDPATAVVFGGGPGWAAALEAALLLKEVALVPAEGVETREGATSAMMALGPGALALSLPAGDGDDPLLAEAEAICAGQGATVIRAPGGETTDRRLAAVSTFPAAAALAARIGLERGVDVDRPAWTDAYYRVARRAR